MEGFSPEWERNRYARGMRVARYPWSDVVTLTFRYLLSPRPAVPRDKIKILELGCGAGANLLFFAREGLSVTGIDGSESAIRLASESLAEQGLTATLKVHDFAQGLSFPEATFDLVLDRASLTHNVRHVVERAVHDIHRVLKPRGLLMIVDFYSTAHPQSGQGRAIEEGTRTDFSQGMFEGVGTVHFTTEDEVRQLLRGYTILHMEHKVYNCIVPGPEEGTAQYNVVAEKR